MPPEIRLVLWGLGAMGSGIARLLLKKEGVRIVAAFDRDPAKAGKDLGELLGLENYGVKAEFPPPSGGSWPEQAEALLLATSSFTREVVEEIKAGVGQGLNIITIAEEMSYPWVQAPDLALEIDQWARAQGVSVLGTGINPGFVLDTLILALTGPCLEVRSIQATRINDLSPFGPTVMRTQGVGTTVAEFEQGLVRGEIVGHVGFQESIHMVARAMGWEVERIEEERRPIVSQVRRETEHVIVEPGRVAGCHHTAVGYVAGEARIKLIHPQQILPQLEGVDTGDYIEIEGVPSIKMNIRPEIPGGLGTIAMAVNMIPQVIAARPGLLSMAEVPVPAAVLGDLREISAWRKGIAESGRKSGFAYKGDWVEIRQEILKPGERAPQIPPDTQLVPLEMRVRGFLLNEEAQAGDSVNVRTRIGREAGGRLADLSPRYAHSFGRPQPELLQIRGELLALLRPN